MRKTKIHGEIHRSLFFLVGILLYKNRPTCIGKVVVVQGNQLTATSIRRTLKRTHDEYENTWKCGEIKPYFSPSAGGYKKKS